MGTIGAGKCMAACLAATATTAAMAAPPPLADIIKPAENGLVGISPGGTYISVTLRVKDRMMLAIIDRKSLKLVRLLDPDDKADIARVSWVNDRRVYLMRSWTGNSVEQAYLAPTIIALDVDGKRRDTFQDAVIDTLVDDDDHVLVARCGKSNHKGCWSHVQKIDARGGGNGPRIADAPMLNAAFTADNTGNVRFAHGWDDMGLQQLWLLEGGSWRLLNDEAVSKVEVLPLGVSRDGSSGFLWTERATGPSIIERITFAGGARDVVMSDPRHDPEYLLWSADGTQPIGAAYGPGRPRGRFWDAADPDARALRQLEVAFPEDGVRFVGGTRDGRHAIVAVEGDRDPGSFYLFDREARRTELVARRKPWLDPSTLAPAQAVSFTASDGVLLGGYLTLPLSSGGRRPPLVVLPHGGPFDIADSWDYDEEVQLLATRGYAVLRVNFRGSAGLGRSFVEAGYRQWGKRMQQDLTEATRWLLAQGQVDPGRVCIWGTSYGGYAALMGAVQAPELYKCVIATAAVADLNTMWKWGDIQRSSDGRNFLAQAVGTDQVDLHEHSPVKHAARIKAEVMLVHGVHDERVSLEHAKAMRKALDAIGKSYEGYFPRKETHGIYGDENRLEYYTRVFRFLDRNIGDAAVASTEAAAPVPAIAIP